MATKKINTDLKLEAKLLDASGSAGTNGQILSSTGTVTDWISLSELQGVDGSGTANYLPIWTDSDTLGDSILSSTGGDLFLNGSDDNPHVYINTSGGDIGDTARIRFNGRAEVGYIDSSVMLTDGGANKDIKLRVNTGSIFFQTNNSTRMTVDDGGNVGVGTTSPSQKFHVNSGATNHVAKFESTNSLAEITIHDDTKYTRLLNAGTDFKIMPSNGASEFVFEGDTGNFLNPNHIRLVDNGKVQFGAAQDLEIFHNGTDSTITNGTGHLYITNESDDKDIIFKSDDGSGGTTPYLKLWGAIESLAVYKDMLFVNDGNGGKLKFGASQDLQIYHDGTNSFIDDSGQGDLRIRSNFLSIEKYTGETMATFNNDNSVALYYNDNKRFETTDSGVSITSTGTGDSLLITNADATSDAAPVITLKRDSSTPADGDYLGQLKFKGESDTGVERVYAKITAKTSDVSNEAEDGLIETAVRSDGSNLIVSRQTHEALKLINGTGLEVDGDTTLLGSVKIPDGSSSNPGLSFSDDTNTGIFRSADDVLRIATGGAVRATVNASGITSALNVYTAANSSFRNYSGVWKATTGTTGNGFEFESADGDVLTMSSTGDATFTGSVTADSFIKDGGTSSQFLKADGSVDSTAYSTTDTTYVSSDFVHDDLTGFVANEHIDWTTDQGATNIHVNNLTGVVKNTGNETIAGEKTFSNNVILNGNSEMQGIFVNQYSEFYDDVYFDAAVEINGAVTLGEGIEADNFTKTGGTSSEFLKADGSVDSNTYITGSTLSNYVNTTTAQTIGGVKTFSDNLGVGTTSPRSKFDVTGGANNGISITSDVGSNDWKNLNFRTYVTEAQANAFDDSCYIFTVNPSSGTETAFSKYGGLVIQGRDNGNSSFAIRLGQGSGHSTHMFMGATGVTTFSNTVTATNFILSSDSRLKENVEDTDNSHIDVDWKTFEMKEHKGQKRYGVIAQELEEKHPEFVRTDDEGMKSVAYVDLLIAKNAELEARLEKLEKLLLDK